jgi:hypothetical protein
MAQSIGFPSQDEIGALRSAYVSNCLSRNIPRNDDTFQSLVKKIAETKISYYLIRMCIDGFITVSIENGQLMFEMTPKGKAKAMSLLAKQ